jgi:hypothetical protein
MLIAGRFSKLLFVLPLVLAALACNRAPKLTTGQAEGMIRNYLSPFAVDSFTDVTIRSEQAAYPVMIFSATLAAHDETGKYTLPHAEFYFRVDKAMGAYVLDPSFSGSKAALFDMRARQADSSLPSKQKNAVDKWAIH